MMSHAESHDPIDPIERELWKRWRSARSRAESSALQACPDLTLLASYVDATLSAAERSGVQEHLADCADCLSAVLQARSVAAAADDQRISAPGTVIGAAKDLVRSPAQDDSDLHHRFQFTRWLTRAGWGAAAAAVLAVSLAGYQVGTASAKPAPSDPDLAAEMTFGLFDVSDSGDLALELMVEGES